MKVYVDELPSCCEDCVCHNGVSGRCKLLHRTTFDIPPRDCPLQSLSEHDKQVCDEIRKKGKYTRNKDWFGQYSGNNGYFMIGDNDLDQIQGENNVKN